MKDKIWNLLLSESDQWYLWTFKEKYLKIRFLENRFNIDSTRRLSTMTLKD